MMSSSILIVEDSVIVSFHLQKTLENEGYIVAGISDSGESALNQIVQHKPDLVLMDIMLDGNLDGIQTAILIKENYGIPVVFITALSNKESIQRAKVAEPYGYLNKPFEDRDIFTVIEMALYRSGIEKKLRQSEQKFYSTLKSIDDGVITIDNSFFVTYANPSAEMMIGLPFSDMQGKTIFDVLRLKNMATGDYPVNPIHCGIEQSNTWPDMLTLMSYNGETIPVSDCILSSIIDTSDQSMGLVLTFKNATDKLERQRLAEESELRNIAGLIEGQEKERTRIAKDLHDGLGQTLNAIKMNIRSFISDEQKCKDLLLLLDEAITDTKRIAENLLPPKIKDFDLPTCLQSLCDQFEYSTSSEVLFSSYLDTSIFPDLVKINLFRIAQEAISNAIRHANASQISVQLIEDENVMWLTIEDNGIGLKPIRNLNGHGLTNIHDRARILRGNCTIESDENRGTIIIIEIPK